MLPKETSRYSSALHFGTDRRPLAFNVNGSFDLGDYFGMALVEPGSAAAAHDLQAGD